METPVPRYITPFGLRMPPDIKASLEATAKANNRSLNSEIVFRLRQSLASSTGFEAPPQPPEPFAGRHPTTAAGPHSDIGSRTSAAGLDAGQEASAACRSEGSAAKTQCLGPFADPSIGSPLAESWAFLDQEDRSAA